MVKYVNGTLTISQAQVNANTINLAGSRVYDGTTVVAANIFTLSGLLNGDTLGLTGAGSVANKNVGVDKTVTLGTLALTNASSGSGLASNYTFVGGAQKATITARPLTISAEAKVDKTYNGLTDANVTLSSDAITTDKIVAGYAPNFNSGSYVVISVVNGATSVSITNSAANFNNKNVGANKLITVTGLTATGADLANYNLANTTATTTGTIIPKLITVTALGKNKVYDATANNTVSLSSTGVVLGDRVTFNNTAATFDTGKDVGTTNTPKAISVSGISISATSVDKGNYTLINTTASTSATITPKLITVTASGKEKIYDGTLDDTVTLASTGILTTVNGNKDDIGFTNTSAMFDTKTAGVAKAVTVSGIAVTGADKGNYTANTIAKTIASITPKTITVTAMGTDKIYDGNLIDAVTLSSTGIIAGDIVTYTKTSALFADKNAGTDKTVNVSGIRLGGTGGVNYKANTTTTTTANITQKAITVTATGINKVYDATLNDAVTLKATGMISGDAYGLSSASALFADKNVGFGKSVTVSGIALTGINAGNYTTNATAVTTATITPKTITVSATGINKVYDGTLIDEVTLKSTGLILGDTVELTSSTALFLTNTVGTAKTVKVSGIALSGTDAKNYKANTTATTTASIIK